VLREAIRCGIQNHGKRRGAVAPTRKRSSASITAPAATDAIPAELRRAVWKRDGGRCAWIGQDGRRCGSRWQLEIDHVDPRSLGETVTLDDLRLCCRPHNFLYAEQVYGRAYMARYRREPERASREGERTIAGESASASG
jgi:hypothetical protein